ncbi:retrovirus-related pol polyprotein from transposon TNT 1-94, partial [Tanacetum coccineum]
MKVLRTDRGGEFLSNEFVAFCEEHGIKRELTAPYSPKQNGVAERKNRIVVEMTRSMMKQKGLPDSFWAEGASTSVYLLNISPTKKASWSWGSGSIDSNVQRSTCEEDEEHTEEEEEEEIESISTLKNSQQSTLEKSSSTFSSQESSPNEALESAQLYPVSVDEALKCDEWRQAMVEELEANERNQTWNLVDLPAGKTPIGVKWVFKTKFFADGSVQRHKVRLVVKGYAQQQGIDYEETFAPVARFETVRVILTLAAQKQWKVYQFDVKSAFLNVELHEEVYINQPPRFEKANEKNKVYKLKKTLYGLKHALRAWYSKIDRFFQENRFERSSSLALISKFRDSMMNMFDMTDLGEL